MKKVRWADQQPPHQPAAKPIQQPSVTTSCELPTYIPNFTKGVHFSMCLYGMRRSGKSTTIRHLYTKHLADLFDIVVVMSNSLNNAISPDFYAEFIPGDLQYGCYKRGLVNKMFELQEKALAKNNRMYDILIILDDIYHDRLRSDDELLQLFIAGRNKNISVVFAIQEYKLLRKTWRMNTDVAIFYAIDNTDEIEEMAKAHLIQMVNDDHPALNKLTTYTRAQSLKSRKIQYIISLFKDHVKTTRESISALVYDKLSEKKCLTMLRL